LLLLHLNTSVPAESVWESQELQLLAREGASNVRNAAFAKQAAENLYTAGAARAQGELFDGG
jgi:hypothetical protein